MISAGEDAQKVGLTCSDPQLRLASLQTGHHTRLTLAGFVPVLSGKARQVEREAHTILSGSRAHGEWFKVSAVAAVRAIETVSGMPHQVSMTVSYGAKVITAGQSRSARALISWSQKRLATASLVAKKTIADFERKAAAPRPRTILALANALQAAGIEFIPENGGSAGVRLRKAEA